MIHRYQKYLEKILFENLDKFDFDRINSCFTLMMKIDIKTAIYVLEEKNIKFLSFEEFDKQAKRESNLTSLLNIINL